VVVLVTVELAVVELTSGPVVLDVAFVTVVELTGAVTLEMGGTAVVVTLEAVEFTTVSFVAA
jgi:hypothetical protein